METVAALGIFAADAKLGGHGEEALKLKVIRLWTKMQMHQIRHFISATGAGLLSNWLTGLPESLVMLLLCGGDKRTQDADIKDAKDHWKDWQRRSAP